MQYESNISIPKIMSFFKNKFNIFKNKSQSNSICSASIPDTVIPVATITTQIPITKSTSPHNNNNPIYMTSTNIKHTSNIVPLKVRYESTYTLDYFKYTNSIVSSILDDIIYDIEVENSSIYNKKNKIYLQKIYDFYHSQQEYSHLQDIFTPDVFSEFEQIINNILLQNPIYLKNLYQLKKYSGDLSDITIRYGVFETNNFIVKIDDEHDVFIPDLELMSRIGNGIVTPYNIVLPYFVRIVNQNKNKQNKNNTENKETKHMHFSIQPRIKNTLSLRTWINLLSNRNYATSYYIQQCITISKSILFMHSHNIVHGDVKPDNILIDISTHRPYIIDFGLSGLHNSSQGTGGTQPFCCPETKNCSFTNSDTYVWTTNKKEYDLWSIAFIFSTIIIFKKSYTFYSDYPRSYFTEDYYINMFFLNRIPIHFREPFILVLSKKSDINLSNFIQLLENSLTLTSPQ